MKTLKQNIILLIILLTTISLTAQEVVKKDSIKQNLKFNYKQLIIPTFLISYGAIGIEKIDYLKELNFEIREEVINDIDRKTTFDDFSQYAPALTVYALNN
ncbi:hypothetical protein ACNQGB_15900 [Flavobacterium sp. XS1P32]|uniref:hypothetical protein n=1 Tax=unclassified Flavobacterium TaxID=196869 RepID=UPI003AAD4F35